MHLSIITLAPHPWRGWSFDWNFELKFGPVGRDFELYACANYNVNSRPHTNGGDLTQGFPTGEDMNVC